MSIIFVFLDGVGLTSAGPDNPLADASMPALHALLGGPLVSEQVQDSAGVLLRGIDATLGVAGTPQSGTGHTALLCGVNAAAMHGRHQPAFPPVALRPLLAEQSVMQRVQACGGSVAFANAFPAERISAMQAGQARRSASVIAAMGAGVTLRTLSDVAAGQALTWDITGEVLQAPPVTPVAAGQTLLRLAATADLVLFECFLPDLVGHGRIDADPAEVLTRIDALLGAVLAARRPADSLLVTSDHGNIESRCAPSHTRNPVPLLLVGPAATTFRRIVDITGVAGAIVSTLCRRESDP